MRGKNHWRAVGNCGQGTWDELGREKKGPVRLDGDGRGTRCAWRVDLGGSEEEKGLVRRFQEPAEGDRERVKAGKSLTSSLPEGKISRWSRIVSSVMPIGERSAWKGELCFR